MRKLILTATALVAGVLTSSAAVTVQGWWPYGEITDIYGDISGNAHRFGYGFSRVGSGNCGALVEPFGCGGPLGTITPSYVSTNCLYWNAINGDAAGMWGPGFNPPPTNYIIECWCLPVWPGTWSGGGTGQPWLFCSGTSGGVYFQLTNDTVSTMTILAKIVGNNVVIGDPVVVTSNRWTHLAIVNDNGTQTFYVNGVQHGAPDVGNATAPAGDIYAGSASGTTPTFAGYLDELRISIFAPGTFSTNDLMTRSMAPNIISQPQSAGVWNGGAAPFTIGVAFDTSTTYQWRRGGGNIGGATGNEYYLNTVSSGDNNAQFDCVLNNYTTVATTSSVATLTIVAPNPSNISAYQNAVKAEAGLVAYYTGDGDSGTTLTDTKGSNTGTLEGTASWDGRTTRAFGVRALRLRNTGDGDVQIPWNQSFEFGSTGGKGTIEGIVYLDKALASGNETIFAQAYDYDGGVYYQIQASTDGTSLIYSDNSPQTFTWAVSPPLLGRQAHVAIVFDNNTVTAYADGLPLGSKAQNGFGTAVQAPAWIGSAGFNSSGSRKWTGTIDELAVYSGALSANTIAIHNSKFLYGTNISSPTITGLPGTGTKTLLAGGRANFTVQAAGTAPLAYQWTTNGTPIPGATSATLTLSPTTVGQSSPTYGVTVSNPYGSTNSPTFGLTFVAPTDRYATLVMGDNPMAYWRLDESSGPTAFDSAGGHDGTFSGSGLTFGAAALPNMANNAVHFVGGYAEIPYSAALNPSTAFSVEFWAMPDDEPSATYVPLCSQYRGGSARAGWCFYDENDDYTFEIHMGDSSGVTMYCYGGGPRPYGGQWYHVAVVYDPNATPNATVYAENEIVGTASGNYVPNASAPLMIGIRNGLSYPIHAVLDEVAMYNYALTPAQLSNHWSIKFQPAAITTQPVGVTTNEGSAVTLTAVASGFPNTYQWYKGATMLTPTANFDGTAHYPQDVTNATLVITETVPSDSGQYHVVVSNPLGGATSANATVAINPDTTPPVVALVQALGTPQISTGPTPFLVKVLFSKRIDQATGVLPGNYVFSGGATVSQVTVRGDTLATSLGTDWKVAFLQTSGLTPGQKYTLTVSGVKDQATTPNTIVPQTVNFWTPPLVQGALSWDYYYQVTPQAVGSLAGFQYYQSYAPTTNSYLTAFDTHQITGSAGDLNNIPAFGSLGDDYGDVVSGWVTPSADGDYTFFLASDDASQLYLSTDETPAGAVLIAEETGCCQAFLEPNPSGTGWHDNGFGMGQTTLTPIHLLANHRYFIRTLHTEGGGGDWLKVAWRIAGDTTPAASLSPIPAQYLSGYVLLPPAFKPPTVSNGQVTISWTGVATLLQSTNVALPLSQWTPVPGNPTSPYQVTPATAGPQMFYRLQQ
jgi:hypothetical protein